MKTILKYFLLSFVLSQVLLGLFFLFGPYPLEERTTVRASIPEIVSIEEDPSMEQLHPRSNDGSATHFSSETK